MRKFRTLFVCVMMFACLCALGSAAAEKTYWCGICSRNVTDVWFSRGESRHTVVCSACNHMITYEKHSGGTATCVSQPKCGSCNALYGDKDADNHDWDSWSAAPDGLNHIRTCKLDAAHTESASHSGGTATCVSPAACGECAAPYGNIDPDNHAPGAAATCTADQVCTRSECGAVLAARLGHIPGAAATCTTDQVCTRDECGAVLAARLGHIPGAAATCTTDQVCTREGCGAVVTARLGHAYGAVVTPPVCTKPGYTTYTCSRCGDSYIANRTEMLGHWYGMWTPGADGTHSAACKRAACGHVSTVACEPFEVTAQTGENKTVLTVCPVCGDHADTPFAALAEAAVKDIDRYALPRGERIVRGMDAPFSDALYALTVAYEFAGKVEDFNGKVSVALPLDAEKYDGFRLVRVDVTPAADSAERSETWTDIAFTCENGELLFETDAAGLYLLLAAE